MGRQVTKRCHWVAQSYLKAFAADDAGKRIWRLSKRDGEPELKPIEKVAVKHHLYVPRAADGSRNDALERKLAGLETYFGHPIWNAVCDGFPDYTWAPLRKMVALLTAVTWLRTPQQLEFWKSLHLQMRDFYGSLNRLPTAVSINDQRIELDPSSWPAFRDANEEDMKQAWSQCVGSAAEFANMFLKMRWAVVVSEEPVFITCDNPVLIGDTLNPFRGLRHPDTMVQFPLSPTRVLMMDNRHSEPDGAFYALKHDPAAVNILTWRNAIEHMFSPRDPVEVCSEFLADAERMGYA